MDKMLKIKTTGRDDSHADAFVIHMSQQCHIVY